MTPLAKSKFLSAAISPRLVAAEQPDLPQKGSGHHPESSALLHLQPNTTPMKTTLLTILLAIPASLSFAQDRKPDAPREERKPDAPREENKELGEREQAQEAKAKLRGEIEHHMKAAMEEAAKLEEAGKKDAAENVRREAKERAHAAMAEQERIMQDKRREGAERGKDRPAARPADGPPRAELEGKLRHVEQAMAHLREAGMPEPAAQINQIANRLRAALRGEGEPRREEPRREDAKRDEPRRERVRPDNDVEALRREIQELRQAVRQLSERKSDH